MGFERGATLREHQEALLRLLRELDRVCRELNIPYMLFAGSLLGAVREKGFIPWDDDLDVIMLREDYDRLMALGDTCLDGETFFLQKEFSEHWPMPFSKLRLQNTACIERYIPKDPLTHQGVYIDIFPMDNLADSKPIRCLQFLASKAVIAKALDRRGYLTDSKLKRVFMVLCRGLPRKPLAEFVYRRKARNTNMLHSFFAASSRYEKSVFPREWFAGQRELPFEDGHFQVPVGYEEILTTLYGDYMTPTPVGERGVKVHAEIVDLENSYEMYEGIQCHMEFKEFTRSIR